MWLDCAPLIESAQANYNARNYERAVSEFEAALPVCGPQKKLLLALGQAQLLAQQFEASVKTFAQASKADARDPLPHKLSGDALYLLGRDPEAEAEFKAALAIDPNHEPSLYSLGRIYYQLNRAPEAVPLFQKVIAMDAANYRAHDNLALCYDAMQEDALALKHFFRALDMVKTAHPDYDWAFANLADFFLRRNQYEKAFQLASEASRRNPNGARNFFLTGKALTSLGKDELSLRWLRRAVELDPAYGTAHYLLAQTLKRLGQEEEARKHLEIFKKVNANPRSRR
jgi:protein O-GlcNAc transferase